MNAKQCLVTAAIIIATAMVTTQVTSQDSKPGDAQAKQHAMMEQWMKNATPSEKHKLLNPLVGKWTTHYEHYESADSAPMEMAGEAEFEWVLDGRFIKGELSGEGIGMPFDAYFFFGYNNFRQRFEAAWLATMSTSIYLFTAEADHTGKVFTFSGTVDDVMMGIKDKPFKSVFRIVNENEMQEIVYRYDANGGEVKEAEVTYTRVLTESGR